jgi:hypothetical protein
LWNILNPSSQTYHKALLSNLHIRCQQSIHKNHTRSQQSIHKNHTRCQQSIHKNHTRSQQSIHKNHTRCQQSIHKNHTRCQQSIHKNQLNQNKCTWKYAYIHFNVLSKHKHCRISLLKKYTFKWNNVMKSEISLFYIYPQKYMIEFQIVCLSFTL